MNGKDMQKDSLASDATAAFAGVLLLAQTRPPPSGTNELPFNIPNPLPPDGALIAIAAFALLLSIVLALASIVAPIRLRVLPFPTLIRPLLSLFTLLAFVVSSYERHNSHGKLHYSWVVDLSALGTASP